MEPMFIWSIPLQADINRELDRQIAPNMYSRGLACGSIHLSKYSFPISALGRASNGALMATISTALSNDRRTLDAMADAYPMEKCT